MEGAHHLAECGCLTRWETGVCGWCVVVSFLFIKPLQLKEAVCFDFLTLDFWMSLKWTFLGICLIGGTFSKLRLLFLLLPSSSFYQLVLLELVCMSFRSSLIRCKSILRPPPASFRPTNIIKPPPPHQHSVSLSLYPRCFLFVHTHSSPHFLFLNVDQSHSVCCPLLLPPSQILLKFVQIGEDASGCTVYTASLGRQQETQGSMMNVHCKRETAVFCLRLSLASLHHIFLLTAHSLNFHNGFLHR